MKFLSAAAVTSLTSLVSFSAFAQGVFLGQAEDLFKQLQEDTSPSYSYVVKGQVSKKALAKGKFNNAVIALIKKDLCTPKNYSCPEFIHLSRIRGTDEAAVLKQAQGIFSFGIENARSSEAFFDLTDLITDLSFDNNYVVFAGKEGNGFGETQFVSIVDKSNGNVATFAAGWIE